MVSSGLGTAAFSLPVPSGGSLSGCLVTRCFESRRRGSVLAAGQVHRGVLPPVASKGRTRCRFRSPSTRGTRRQLPTPAASKAPRSSRGRSSGSRERHRALRARVASSSIEAASPGSSGSCQPLSMAFSQRCVRHRRERPTPRERSEISATRPFARRGATSDRSTFAAPPSRRLSSSYAAGTVPTTSSRAATCPAGQDGARCRGSYVLRRASPPPFEQLRGRHGAPRPVAVQLPGSRRALPELPRRVAASACLRAIVSSG